MNQRIFTTRSNEADSVPLTKTRLNESNRYETNDPCIRYVVFTFGYNPPVFSQRVRDILSLVAFARSEKYAAELVDVIGLDGAGHWVAAARAIAGDKIDRAAIDTAGFRFANLAVIDDELYRRQGKMEGATLRQAFDELRQIYHAEKANPRLRLPMIAAEKD